MLKRLCEEVHGKYVYIRRLMEKGLIKEHRDDSDHLCYDTEELEDYRKTHRNGRPSKFFGKQGD